MAKNKKRKGGSHSSNPLLNSQQRFLQSLPTQVRSHFFSPTHVMPEQRAEIWEAQADIGEELVNTYAWATPDPRLLKVFQHFSPIIEIGSGANAYWSRWMHTEGNVDVFAIDISLDSGGKILSKKANKNNLKNNDRAMNDDGFIIHQGGPETLSQDETIRDSDRTLFLCYPDEEDKETPTNDEGDEAEEAPLSMAAACLEHYTGSTVIHVGELYGDTLSLDQAPFGRSSSSEFQTRLAGEYHCILKMQLKSNWLHTRDTLSVWKRSEACCMAFEKDDNDEDDDDGSDEDMYYKYIPPTEQLPVDVAAPCVVHLLNNDRDSDNGRSDRSSTTNEAASKSIPQQETNVNNKKSIEKKRKKKKKKEAHDAIAGNAW